MPVDILTDEQALAIWSGQTSSILGLEDSASNEGTGQQKAEPKEPAKDATQKEPAEPLKTDVKDADLDNVFAEDEPEEEEEQGEKDKNSTTPHVNPQSKDKTVDTPTKQVQQPQKGGRKSDFVNLVNKLVKEETLFGFEDDKGDVSEIQTLEEAEHLIKENLKFKVEDSKKNWWEDKKKEYSPQIQAILHYADQGVQSATELAQLIGAIQQVEDTSDLDISTKEGQELTIREAFKAKGFKDAYINKQLTTLKDLGEEKLKEAAEDLLPDLQLSRTEKVKQTLQQAENRRKEAEEASKVYVSTIKQTLDQDIVGNVKLAREDKAKLYEAVTQPKYTSLNGKQTNLFVKTLEELQFGKKSDYNHFMNIVHFTVDPKGFVEKLKTSVGNSIADETFKKLKTAKNNTANTSNEESDSTRGSSPRKTITKSGFTNPYA